MTEKTRNVTPLRETHPVPPAAANPEKHPLAQSRVPPPVAATSLSQPL